MVQIRMVADSDLTVLPTAFQVLTEDLKKGLTSVNRRAIDKISQRAHLNFLKSLENPGVSASIGRAGYRPGDRATGNFTFGKGKTFTGSLLRNLGPNISGFGYPIVERANQRTDGAWRALEFGRPAFRMPPGYWTTAIRGNRARRRSPGGDVFNLGGRNEVLAQGIEPKNFIGEAFEHVTETFVQPEYDMAAKKAARKASSARKS